MGRHGAPPVPHRLPWQAIGVHAILAPMTTMPETTQAKRDSNAPIDPPAALLEAITTVRRPMVLGHIVPDADCLGAGLALATTLREHDVDARFGMPNGAVSHRLQFMLDLVPDAPPTADWPADPDGIIAVDTAAETRVDFDPRPDFSTHALTLNIDHHITNTGFAKLNWVDPRASSACEMVARLIQTLGWSPSSPVASLLYAGIHGDTAGFSLPGTSADALHVAADLVRAGADVAQIGECLCRSQARSDFELLRRVYDNTTVTAGGRIAFSRLSHAEIIESNCTAADIDDQVSIPRALKGVRIALLFTEGEPGITRVNLRGDAGVPVIEIAQQFGGGGHTQSAGMRVRSKPMAQVIEEVVRAAEAHLDALGQ